MDVPCNHRHVDVPLAIIGKVGKNRHERSGAKLLGDIHPSLLFLNQNYRCVQCHRISSLSRAKEALTTR